jgi:acetylxylan esterase
MHSIATFAAVAGLATSVLGNVIEQRQSCPAIHIFGARETTAPAGYGTAGQFVNLILNAYSGSTAEAIDYPAQGDSAYGSSVRTGTQNIANQINAFNKKCPNSKLVVVGYSQVCTLANSECWSSANQTRAPKSATMLYVAAEIRTRALQTPVHCSRLLRAQP